MGLPEQATLGLTPKWRNEAYGWTSAKRALKRRGDQVKALLWNEAGQPEVGVTGGGGGGALPDGGDPTPLGL